MLHHSHIGGMFGFYFSSGEKLMWWGILIVLMELGGGGGWFDKYKLMELGTLTIIKNYNKMRLKPNRLWHSLNPFTKVNGNFSFQLKILLDLLPSA